MTRWRSWLGALLVAQLVSAPVYAQWDGTGAAPQDWTGSAPRDWTGAAPPAPPADDGVWVELHSHGAPVRIERVFGDAAIPVCTAPCRQKVPRSGIYRIGGEGVVPSANFDLTQEQWGVTLEARPASSMRRAAGLTLAIAGLAMLLTSSAIEGQGDGAALDETPVSHREQVAAGFLLVSGLAAGVVGLVLMLTSNTRVTSSNGVSF